MTDIQDVLREMREDADSPEVRGLDEVMLNRWADAIEAAMREPVAYLMENKEYPHLAKSLHFAPPEWHITWAPKPLFTLPPDAAGEIEDLRDSRDFYKRRCDALQKAQRHMRDPERKAVCDILANGKTAAEAGAALAGKEDV